MEPPCDFAAIRNVDIDDLIDGYLANRISQPDADDFEMHILECEECYQKLYIREQTIGLVQEKGESIFADLIGKEKQRNSFDILQPVVTAFSGLKSGKKLRWGYAAALIVASLLAIVLLTEDHELPRYNERFQAHVYFDELITNQDYRRATEGIKLLSPARGASFRRGENILFRWETENAVPVNLRILNNKGEKLYNYTDQTDQYTFKEKLAPGLYYWRIEANNDFRLSKFFVDQR